MLDNSNVTYEMDAATGEVVSGPYTSLIDQFYTPHGIAYSAQFSTEEQPLVYYIRDGQLSYPRDPASTDSMSFLSLGYSTKHKNLTSDTFCQGCLRTFFAVIQNQTLDFVAHGFFARFTEMDFDAVGGLSDFLYHYRWRGFLYGQRGSGCGGAAVAGVVVHRLSFP